MGLFLMAYVTWIYTVGRAFLKYVVLVKHKKFKVIIYINSYSMDILLLARWGQIYKEWYNVFISLSMQPLPHIIQKKCVVNSLIPIFNAVDRTSWWPKIAKRHRTTNCSTR